MVEGLIMTRQEAIAYMLSTHKPIAHKLFGKGEFVQYDGMNLKDESNTYLHYGEFWAIRSGGEWEDGWFKV